MTPDATPAILRLKAETAGDRLDRFLVRQLPQYSRAHIQKLFETGNVLVNGRPAKSGSRTAAGDTVEVTFPPEPPSLLAPEAMPLVIVYEDKDILVIDKPPGLTVYPAAGHAEHTLLNGVLHYAPELVEWGGNARPGIVHRLDKDTSGLIVIARNGPAQEYLVRQFQARTVKKLYLVLVQGRLEPATGRVEAPIGRHPSERQRMAVVADGREARTAYRVKEYIGDASLLEVTLETGRTHQIRVHFGAIGFPVMGDAVYGVKSPVVPRQFVHAHRLGFTLPASGEYREFVSPLPADLSAALEALRGKTLRGGRG